ncbi:MAG: hypothetical protein GY868_02505 [Deltaproteobacteria bacterium]|nr:hypothetical protein [Deltaproteobacteria bacterium]
MSDHFCDRCGEYLPEGSFRYTVHVQIVSDFDGMIFFQDDCDSDDTAAPKETEEITAEMELEEEVYQELTMVLCGNCKKAFASDPFNRGTGLMRRGKSFERMFH